MGAQTTSQETIEAQRRELAIEFRIRGVSYRKIAELVRNRLALSSYSHMTAKRDCQAALHESTDEDDSSIEEMRIFERLRLDQVFKEAWLLYEEADDFPTKLRALDKIMKASEQVRRLYGLDLSCTSGVDSPGVGSEMPSAVFRLANSDDVGHAPSRT